MREAISWKAVAYFKANGGRLITEKELSKAVFGGISSVLNKRQIKNNIGNVREILSRDGFVLITHEDVDNHTTKGWELAVEGRTNEQDILKARNKIYRSAKSKISKVIQFDQNASVGNLLPVSKIQNLPLLA